MKPFVPKHFIILIAFEVKLKITQRFKLGKYCRNFALCLFHFFSPFYTYLYLYLCSLYSVIFFKSSICLYILLSNITMKARKLEQISRNSAFFFVFFFFCFQPTVFQAECIHLYFSRNVNVYISFSSHNVLYTIVSCVLYLTKNPN